MTIDTKKFQMKRAPKDALTADMIDGDLTVVEVTWAGEVERNDKSGSFIVIETKEFPHHQYKTGNKGQAASLMALVERKCLPDEYPAWTGKRIPLVKRPVENPETGEEVLKLYACDPKDYAKLLRDFDKAKAAAVAEAATPPRRPRSRR